MLMFSCVECRQSTVGLRLRRGSGALLPGTYVAPVFSALVVRSERSEDGVCVTSVGISRNNIMLDAVAFPLPDGNFFVTRGSLVGAHYPGLIGVVSQFFADLSEPNVPVIPILVMESGVDSLQPDREKCLQFRDSHMLGKQCVGKPNTRPWLYAQTLTECAEMFTVANRVFFNGGKAHWQSYRDCGYVVTATIATPTCRVRVQSFLQTGNVLVGTHPSGQPCIFCKRSSTWFVSESDVGETPSTAYNIDFTPSDIFFRRDGSPLAFCNRDRVDVGGHTLLQALSYFTSDGDETVAALGPDYLILLQQDRVAAVTVRTPTAVALGPGMLVYAKWSHGVSTVECCTTSNMRWGAYGTASMCGGNLKDPDTLQVVPVGNQRIWAVSVTGPTTVLCGGNDWAVTCVDLVSKQTLWTTRVDNVVLYLSPVAENGVAVIVAADGMRWLHTKTQEICAMPHSSTSIPGLCLENGRFKQDAVGNCCSLCGQQYPHGHVGGYCMNASGSNLCVLELPRILGVYGGQKVLVSDGQRITSNEPCMCGSSETYDRCCGTKHSKAPIVSVHCGNDDHTYLATLASGPYFVQSLADWVHVAGTSELFERFPEWNGQKYDPLVGALLTSTCYGLGKVNDSQFHATPDQSGLLRTKNPINVEQGMVILKNNLSGKLVPAGIMFCLKRGLPVTERMPLRVEYGADFSH